jgi:hypothetical protein
LFSFAAGGGRSGERGARGDAASRAQQHPQLRGRPLRHVGRARRRLAQPHLGAESARRTQGGRRPRLHQPRRQPLRLRRLLHHRDTGNLIKSPLTFTDLNILYIVLNKGKFKME